MAYSRPRVMRHRVSSLQWSGRAFSPMKASFQLSCHGQALSLITNSESLRCNFSHQIHRTFSPTILLTPSMVHENRIFMSFSAIADSGKASCASAISCVIVMPVSPAGCERMESVGRSKSGDGCWPLKRYALKVSRATKAVKVYATMMNDHVCQQNSTGRNASLPMVNGPLSPRVSLCDLEQPHGKGDSLRTLRTLCTSSAIVRAPSKHQDAGFLPAVYAEGE